MPELRKDPVVDRWVSIASERGIRPTDFNRIEQARHGGFCPFCPGNESRIPSEIAQWGRPAGAPANSSGWRGRVVPNKFPAFVSEGETNPRGLGMFDMMNAVGAHEIIIENPAHDWDLADGTVPELREIISTYISRARELRRDRRFSYLLVFRNYGASAGATLEHPHSQIIALPITPKMVKEHLEAAREYYQRKGRCVYCDVLRQELSTGERIVEANDHFVVMSPYAARSPFELHLYPRRHSHDFTLMNAGEIDALGDTLARNLRRLRGALNNPPYNLMFQTAPVPHPQPGQPGRWGTIAHDFHWRIDILPRVTNIAGFEWGTGFYINPVAPESVPGYLREIEP
jgi:UDPglucose--hexose-1-phosphate uridylyltransferase